MKCPKCSHRKAKDRPCKFCERIKTKNKERKPIGLLRKRYRDLLKRSKDKLWPIPNFTSDEFVNYFEKDQEFLRIFENFKNKKFHKDYSPSVDRIDSSKPYLWENIRIIRWEENRDKRWKEDVENGTFKPEIPDEELCEFLY